METNFFDTNYHPSILDNWGVHHALRELVINAQDANIENDKSFDSIEFNYFSNNKIVIKDNGNGLLPDNFIVKKNKNRVNKEKLVGEFGFGLKDAIAVLIRENCKILITSRNLTFKPIMLKVDGKKEETINIEWSKNNNFYDGTKIEIDNVTINDYENAKKFFLFLLKKEKNIIPIVKTKYGEIYSVDDEILDYDGIPNIYYNGVKIGSNKKLSYSYNIIVKNEFFIQELNRERMNISTRGYSKIIDQIILECKNQKIIDNLFEKGFRRNDNIFEKQRKQVRHTLLEKQSNINNTIYYKKEHVIENIDFFSRASKSGFDLISLSNKIYDEWKEYVYALTDETLIITTFDEFMERNANNLKHDWVEISDLNYEEKIKYDKLISILKKTNYFQKIKKSGYDFKLTVPKIKDEKIEFKENRIGGFDKYNKVIWIHKDLLEKDKDFIGTVLHEIAHMTSGKKDEQREFEDELTNMLGEISIKL